MKATRSVVQAQIKSDTPAEVYARNEAFVAGLMEEIKEHKLFSHPIVSRMQNGQLSKEAVTRLHMDFRLLTKQFTDVILAAQFLTREIDVRHGMNHMPARFLITLNLLDELGFEAGQGDYEGTPNNSHYILFDKVVADLRGTTEGLDEYSVSAPTRVLHGFVEEHMNDFLATLLYIAVTEEEAMVYSPPMREAARAVGVPVDKGYYNVHGTSEDEDTEAEDDEHQRDILVILAQYLTEEDYPRVRELAFSFCDKWLMFWEDQNAYELQAAE